MSEREPEQYQRPETGSPKSNAAVINVINSSCAFDAKNVLPWKGSIVLKLSELPCIIDSAAFALEKTHAWVRSSLCLLLTLSLCHVQLAKWSNVLKQHADQASFEREPTEERRNKNTSMTGTLVTFQKWLIKPLLAIKMRIQICPTEVIKMSCPNRKAGRLPSIGWKPFRFQRFVSSGKYSMQTGFRDYEDAVESITKLQLKPPATRRVNK